jgi:hypothetical protein
MTFAWPPRPGTVAVMQPYFYPYSGYFRLLAAAQTFVIFDDVQFPRRGRVHRCKVPGRTGASEWLTLPLAHSPRDILIKNLAFRDGARAIFDQRLARLPWLEAPRGPLAERLGAHLHAPLETVTDFLEAGLRLVADALQLPAHIVRSSDFALDPALRGQKRVIALVEAANGRIYVNAPGGIGLYDGDVFLRQGIALEFLIPYDGAYKYMLPALMNEDPAQLREDILRSTHVRDETIGSLRPE